MKILLAIMLIAIITMIAKTYVFAFRAQSSADYSGSTPQFDLRRHLSGDILAEGLIYGPTGKLAASFVADMKGEWDGTTGTLSENFTYSSGRSQQRKWFLTITSDNSFTATADDIVGEAQGTVSGSTVRLDYKLILPDDAGGHILAVTDWMYLTENGTIMNKSEMRKFGLKVGELIATMRQAN